MFNERQIHLTSTHEGIDIGTTFDVVQQWWGGSTVEPKGSYDTNHFFSFQTLQRTAELIILTASYYDLFIAKHLYIAKS